MTAVGERSPQHAADPFTDYLQPPEPPGLVRNSSQTLQRRGAQNNREICAGEFKCEHCVVIDLKIMWKVGACVNFHVICGGLSECFVLPALSAHEGEKKEKAVLCQRSKSVDTPDL